MILEAVTIQASPREHESLAIALRAIARMGGVDPNYDEICAALGISLVAIVGPAESSPALWPTFGRDAFLAPTARLFGIHLRDLHPPEVGVDMLWAEEFAQHFDLSYKPLIRQALQNEQPVLAWGGWAGDPTPRWGVLTTAADEDLLGVVPGTLDPVQLSHPALQCYVVEHYEPRTPSSEEVFDTAMTHAHGFLTRSTALFQHLTPPGSKIVAGPAAFDVWATWLQSQRPGNEADPAREAFRIYTKTLCSARTSAARFLARSDAAQGPSHAAMMDAIMHACDSFAAELGLLCRPAEVHALWQTAEGHQELLENIRTAQAIDRQIADCVSRLVSAA